jgi:hypothetical protein
MRRLAISLVAVGLSFSACNRDADVSANEAAVLSPTATAAVATANAAAAAPAVAAVPAYTLAGNGLQPGLAFGTPRSAAVEAARAAFGTPTGREHNDECGEGPMDFISFRGLQLGFREGRLTGWALSGADPALRSAGGLAVGAPRSVLGDAEVDRESTLGPEFSIGGIGGILDEGGSRIEALWAGDACQFR